MVVRAVASTSSTWPRRLPMATTPSATRCQTSRWPTSATPTPSALRRSFTRRTDIRLSLSDCASGRKTSTDRSATNVETSEPGCRAWAMASPISRLSPAGLGDRRGDALHGEHLDDVADLQIVVALEADAALEARLDLGHVVLEAAQRAQLALVDHHVVAQQARLRLARALDDAVGDHAAGDGAELRRLEDLPHLGRAEPHFLERRLEDAGHRLLDLVGHVVDDRVQPHVDLLALGDLRGVAIRPHVEADDDGVRGQRQQHVELVDGADTRMDDADLDALVAELLQRAGQHLGRALHVGLDDDRQLLDAALGDLLLEGLEREAARLRRVRPLLLLVLAEQGDLARLGR